MLLSPICLYSRGSMETPAWGPEMSDGWYQAISLFERGPVIFLDIHLKTNK